MAEVYGTAFIETARDKVVALLNTLVTDMASGYNPTINYVYERHDCAKLLLNGVTVGLIEPVEADIEAVGSSGVSVQYTMPIAIRVHTAYEGGNQDDQNNARLLNSIANKMKANINMGDGYRILDVTDIAARETFAESATMGGSLTVMVSKVVIHEQE